MRHKNDKRKELKPGTLRRLYELHLPVGLIAEQIKEQNQLGMLSAPSDRFDQALARAFSEALAAATLDVEQYRPSSWPDTHKAIDKEINMLLRGMRGTKIRVGTEFVRLANLVGTEFVRLMELERVSTHKKVHQLELAQRAARNARAERRNKFLEQQRPGWSDWRWAIYTGLDRKTIARYRAGEIARPGTIKTLAEKLQVPESQVPE
jgi:hypothetical protein